MKGTTMKTIKDYPELKGIRPSDSDISWIFTGKWSILDNFALTPVLVNIGHGMKLYPTSEHAFAAAKADSPGDAELIRLCQNPGVAKAMGRRVPLRPDWEQVKFEVMWHVLKAKFDQHAEACEVLLATKERLIYEGNTWEDRVWGIVERPGARHLWDGRNALGVQLMEIRGMLQRGEPLK